MRELLDGLGIGRGSLVGASYGSFLALNYAIAEPERVAKLLVTSPAAGITALRKSFYARVLMSMVIPGRSVAERLLDGIFADRFPRDRPVVQQLLVGSRGLKPRIKVYPRVFKDSELRRISRARAFGVGRKRGLLRPEGRCETRAASDAGCMRCDCSGRGTSAGDGAPADREPENSRVPSKAVTGQNRTALG